LPIPKTYNQRQLEHLRAQAAHAPWGDPGKPCGGNS
jgi:hypothetical protein